MAYVERTGTTCVMYDCQGLSDYTDAIHERSVDSEIQLDAIEGVLSRCELFEGTDRCAASEALARLTMKENK